MNLDDLIGLVAVYKTSGMTDLQVAAKLTTLLHLSDPRIDEAIEAFDEQADRIRTLVDPPAVVDEREVGGGWYLGPRQGDRFWWPLRDLLSDLLPCEAVESVDAASTKVVSLLGPPGAAEIGTRGLVLGHVQSGKTTNFAAVITKAADAGYDVVIVLAGMHNSLRSQTQERMNQYVRESSPSDWFSLTSVEQDFVMHTGHTASATLSAKDKKVLVVIKKNGSRLRSLLKWLRSGDPRIVATTAFLVIDDEADQASIDTSKREDEEKRSTINALLVELLSFKKVAYVGYTATPFANFLIDPDTPEDLYPKDFIIDLPRPEEYFGPERLFGSEMSSSGAEQQESDGLDIVRIVPEDEADDVRPRSKSAREEFVPYVSTSMGEAIRYFLLGTAARRLRSGETKHSTMLIHTSLYSEIQNLQARAVDAYVKGLLANIDKGDVALLNELRRQWHRELDRMPPEVLGLDRVEFDDLLVLLPMAVLECQIKVDNYRSIDRLTYEGGPKTVIVVGGNTLSRGLTLEGLLVSYFVRTSSAYDTLLQMGRWFGYRVGYEDLPRVWMTDELRLQFFDLATVEREIRMDISRYEREGKTPLELPVRIRTHPKLMVTARAKMQYAVDAQVSYSGRRLQTILFDHTSADWLATNLAATRVLLRGLEFSEPRPGQFIAHGVSVDRVLEFLGDYQFHDDAVDLESKPMIEYIKSQVDLGELELWNVAVLGQATNRAGTLGLGTPRDVDLVVRSRVNESGHANIKTLLSRPDSVADLDVSADLRKASWGEQVEARPKGVGLLMILPIAHNSKPSKRRGKMPRYALEAADDVIGVGLAFPDATEPTSAHTYISAPITPIDIDEMHAEIEEVGI